MARSIPRRCVSPLAAGVSPRPPAAPLHRGIPPAATRHRLPHQRRKGVGVKHRRRRRRLLLRGDAAIRLLLWRRGILLLGVLRRGCPVLLLRRRRAAAAAVLGWRAAVPTLGPKPWLWAHAWLAIRRVAAWLLGWRLVVVLRLLLRRTVLQGWRLAVLCWRPLLVGACRGCHAIVFLSVPQHT